MSELKFTKSNRPYGLVYLVTNLVNGMVYVGQTRDTHRARWRGHVQYAKNGNTWLAAAIREFGKKAFSVQILCRGYSKEHLDALEGYYISMYDSTALGVGYNMRCWGFSRTPEQMSESGRKQLGKLNHCYRHDVCNEDIVSLYERGFSIAKISQKFDIATGSVASRLREAGVKIDSKPSKAKVDEESLCQEYQNGLSLAKTSKKFSVSTDTAKRILTDNGVGIRSLNRTAVGENHWHYNPSIDMDLILKMRNEGKTNRRIADYFGVKREVIESRMQNWKRSLSKKLQPIPARSGKDNGNFRSDIPTEDIIERYSKGISLRKIAEHYKTGKTTITKRLLNAGVSLRNPSEAQLVNQSA